MGNIDFIRWAFKFGIFINQKASFLSISRKTRLKSAVLILTALFSLFCRINKLEQWNNIFFNLCDITYLYKLLNLNYNNFGQIQDISKYLFISELPKMGQLYSEKRDLYLIFLISLKRKILENFKFVFFKEDINRFISELFLSDNRGLRYTG